MVADHLIEFKGCRRHTRVMGDGISGMEEFVKNRKRLRRRIPEFGDPDFAQVERLPLDQRSHFDCDPNQSMDRSKKQSIDWPPEALANRSTVFEPRSDRSVDQPDKMRFGGGVGDVVNISKSLAHTRG